MSSFLEASGPLAEQAWAWFVAAATVVLLVAAWRVLGALVQRHREADPRAGRKRLAALAAGLLLGVGGFVAFASFEAQAKEGTHRTFVNSLNLTVGESEYLENLKTTQSKPATIQTQRARLAEANATLAGAAPAQAAEAKDERDGLWAAFNASRDELAKAQARLIQLTPNHLLWQDVAPLLEQHRDDEARRRIEEAARAGLRHDYKDSHLQDVTLEQGLEDAYHHKQASQEQMTSQLRWFLYPNLTGLFLAPFIFAGGSILRRAFVASDTVGYKPYPAKSMGFFLLLGGFSVLAVPFAAWTVRDLARRSKEGQIAL